MKSKDILINTLDKYKKKKTSFDSSSNEVNSNSNHNYKTDVHTPSNKNTVDQLNNTYTSTSTTTSTNPTKVKDNTSLSMQQKDSLVSAGLMKKYVEQNKGWNDLAQDEVKSLLSQLDAKNSSNNQDSTNVVKENISTESDAFQSLISQMQDSLRPVDYKQVYGDIMGMLPKQKESKTLGWDEALDRAKSTLNPIYDQRMDSVLKNVDMGNLSRGFYGQLPGEALKLENMTNEESARVSAISSFANDLVGKSEADARSSEAMNMQKQAQMLGVLQNALGYENSSRQANISNLSGLVDMFGKMDDKERQQKLDDIMFDWKQEDRDWFNSSRLTEKERGDLVWNWQVDDREKSLSKENEDREYERSLRDIVLDMKKLEHDIASNNDYGVKAKAEIDMKILQEELRKARSWKASSSGGSSSKDSASTYNDTIVGIYSTVYSMNPDRAYTDLQNKNSSLRKQILEELSAIGHKDSMNFLHELESDLLGLLNGETTDPNYYSESNYDKYLQPDY